MALGAALFRMHYMSRFMMGGKDKLLIVYRRSEGLMSDYGALNRAYTVDEGCYVIPFLEATGIINESDIPFNKTVRVQTLDGTNMDITMKMVIGVGYTPGEVAYATSRIMNASVEEMHRRADELLEYGLKINMKDHNVEDIAKYKAEFEIYLQQLISWYLKYTGLFVRKSSLLSYQTVGVDLIDVKLKDLKKE
ncbi:yuaG [Acrasis kona]|uniref:YuaG n=1 Tax=Acrasis kona TaxID=1008807 RepID=A0AAW2YKC0_9EUKA